ncbi:hypothetical protein BKA70DRAFT_1185488 [Coprinopsis sp. MPI-PUGE-AT-0042]|nr:hypothetical protein BKA70DRAFT_1185488 [Coprinopsis sp. MPI-PUGE-AT-0042]
MASDYRPPSDKEMNSYGGMYAADIFVGSVLDASLLAVQIILVLYGVSGFFATPKDRRKGRLRFIIISALILVMCTIDISFDLWEGFIILYNGGPDGVSYLRGLGIEDKDWPWGAVGDALFFTAIALGDILMLWRCLVLWTDKKWVVLFPSLACLGSITSNIITLVGSVNSDVRLQSKVYLARAVTHVVMNLMVTFLIVLRVMRARSCAVKAFPDQKPPRWYFDVMVLVVESAAPLAIFGICFIALTVTGLSDSGRRLESGRVLQRGRRNIAGDVVQCFYDAFCTLSPQMIIVRVTRGNAWKSSMVEASDGGADLSQPIQFAHSAKETTASTISDSIPAI